MHTHNLPVPARAIVGFPLVVCIPKGFNQIIFCVRGLSLLFKVFCQPVGYMCEAHEHSEDSVVCAPTPTNKTMYVCGILRITCDSLAHLLFICSRIHGAGVAAASGGCMIYSALDWP